MSESEDSQIRKETRRQVEEEVTLNKQEKKAKGKKKIINMPCCWFLLSCSYSDSNWLARAATVHLSGTPISGLTISFGVTLCSYGFSIQSNNCEYECANDANAVSAGPSMELLTFALFMVAKGEPGVRFVEAEGDGGNGEGEGEDPNPIDGRVGVFVLANMYVSCTRATLLVSGE